MSEAPATTAPRFDRCVPETLLALLEPGEALDWLVSLVSQADFADRALDLQLRAIVSDAETTQTGHATLYVGLTKAIDIEVRGRRFRAKVAVFERGRKLKPVGFAGELRMLPSLADELVKKTLAAIHAVPSKRYIDKEGWVQALIGRGRERRFAAVDRESVVSFESERAKRAALQGAQRGLSAPVYEALAEAGHRWAKEPWRLAQERLADNAAAPSFGDELDALGIDAEGRTLLIEVKSGLDTGGVGWTPLQVARYMHLFGSWAKPDPKRAATAVGNMLAQRTRLGLVPAGEWPVRSPIELVPVIAIGGDIKNPAEANRRMKLVIEAVDGVDPGLLRGLEIWHLDRDVFRDHIRLGNLRHTPGA